MNSEKTPVPYDFPRENQARIFAVAAHGALEQRCRYTGEPYCHHLKTVANLVRDETGSVELTSAAWLHDVLQNTWVSTDDLYQEFSNQIARLVYELTDVTGLSGTNRTMRRKFYRDFFGECSEGAQLIKCADIIDNARSIRRHDPEFWKVYSVEALALLDVMKYRGRLWDCARLELLGGK